MKLILVALVVLQAVLLTSASPLPHSAIKARFGKRSISHSFKPRSFSSFVDWLCYKRDCKSSEELMNNVKAYVGSRQDTVTTSLGKVSGYSSGDVTRYTLPYAKPPVGELRFQPPVAVAAWNSTYDASKLPAACPQSSSLSQTQSANEDCMYMNVFVPQSISSTSLPVFVWIHGGSFVAGSSTDHGLDGSTLASNGKMIVVTLQYRLGILGLLRQSSLEINGNMAVLDVVQALTFIKENIAAFGGSASSVTVAGQSSGADLIKTLLTVPSADNLFQRAILHSAPLNYGDQPISTAELVGYSFLQAAQCTDLDCLKSASVEDILNAQNYVFSSAPYSIAGVAASEPIRPVVDGTVVQQPFVNLVNNGGFSNKNRQLVFTTVKDEAGPTIAAVSQDQPIEPEYYDAYIQALMDADRSQKVDNSQLYELDGTDGDGDAARDELEELGTDWVWRCANQQTAVNITMHNNAPQVYLAEFDVGIPYPSNQGIPYCNGKVCHQDDIEAVFSTGESLTSDQRALQAEVLARWSAFATSGSPNADGYVQWNPIQASVSSTNVQLNMLSFEGSSSTVDQTQRQPECGLGGFWGRIALFDEQIYVKKRK